MLTLHVEANTYEKLLSEAERVLGIKFQPIASPIPQPAAAPLAAPPSPAPTPTTVDDPAPLAADKAPDAVSSNVVPLKRGRPVGSGKKAAAPAPLANAQEAGVKDPVPAPAAPAPMTATEVLQRQAAGPGAATYTQDDLRALLQKVVASKPGNEGLDASSKIIEPHRKFKDIPPQDFAAIAEKCKAYLAA